MVKVLLVDDHPVFTSGAAGVLEAEPGLDVVGQAQTGTEAMQAIVQYSPDVILLDIRLTGKVNGIEVARRTRLQYPHIKIIVLSNYGNDPYIQAMMEVGVEGYILKDTPPREVIESIRMVMSGQSVLSASVSETVVRGYLAHVAHPEPLPDEITEREAEVLRLLAEGATDTDISEHLKLAPTTVRFHLTNLYGKLGVQSRAEAIILAARRGLVVIDEPVGESAGG